MAIRPYALIYNKLLVIYGCSIAKFGIIWFRKSLRDCKEKCWVARYLSLKVTTEPIYEIISAYQNTRDMSLGVVVC